MHDMMATMVARERLVRENRDMAEDPLALGSMAHDVAALTENGVPGDWETDNG